MDEGRRDLTRIGVNQSWMASFVDRRAHSLQEGSPGWVSTGLAGETKRRITFVPSDNADKSGLSMARLARRCFGGGTGTDGVSAFALALGASPGPGRGFGAHRPAEPATSRGNRRGRQARDLRRPGNRRQHVGTCRVAAVRAAVADRSGQDPTFQRDEEGSDPDRNRPENLGAIPPVNQSGGVLVPFRNPGPAFSANRLITRDFSSSPYQTEPNLAVDPPIPTTSCWAPSTTTSPRCRPTSASTAARRGMARIRRPYLLQDLGRWRPVAGLRPRRERLHDEHLHRRRGLHRRPVSRRLTDVSSIAVSRFG